MSNFHSLKIKEVKKETAEAVSVTFEVPANLKEIFEYKPGQYLTLKTNLNGQEQRRAYSICTSPYIEKELTIAIKKVKNGVVSTFLNTQLKAGDSLEVMSAQGRFTPTLNAENKKTYFLFGGGSGITPLISIAKSVLEVEPKSKIHLLYGNLNEESIIFKEQLDQLQNRYSGQFLITYVLAQPKVEKEGGVFGLFKKSKTSWNGKVGILDKKMVNSFVQEHSDGDFSTAMAFLCGPGEMMKSTEELLLSLGMTDKQVMVEWFSDPNAKPAAQTTATGVVNGATVVANIGNKTHTFTVDSKESILDAMRRLNMDPPYSCLAGACATCMAKVTKGSVKMDTCFALDKTEISEGYCLTCQAHPTSPEVELTFKV
jgi:ring-1,2-phenylacetyl-CoA epoxidase subunit PaaE